MNTLTRISTTVAALALLAAPAAFAGERTSQDEPRSERGAATCACMDGDARRGEDTNAMERQTAQPSAPEYPLFTDQG